MHRRSTKKGTAAEKHEEQKELQEMRQSIEEMERELAELDRDIAEARKGDKGEMSRVALANFRAMRRDIVEMIASSRELYKTVLESEDLERAAPLLGHPLRGQLSAGGIPVVGPWGGQ